MGGQQKSLTIASGFLILFSQIMEDFPNFTNILYLFKCNKLSSSPHPPSEPMFVIVENRNVNGESYCVPSSHETNNIWENTNVNIKFKQQKYVKHKMTTQLL